MTRTSGERAFRQPGRSVVDAVPTSPLSSRTSGHHAVSSPAGPEGPQALATRAQLPEQVAGVLCIAGRAPHAADSVNVVEGIGEENIDETGLPVGGEEAIRPAVKPRLLGCATPTQPA